MGYKSLLLIDDDEDDQEIFLSALENISKTVKCSIYSDAAEALRALENNLLHPEVIFLDLNMPLVDGQQFLGEIKQIDELKDIPVIIFSTSSYEGSILLTKKMGAHDFITKPTSFNALIQILRPFIL
jgi:CheY-like chemotaxis protein